MQCTSVPILSVLDQKNDEKCDNRRRSIYYQLPGIGVMKIRTCSAPKYDREHSEHECPSRSHPSGSLGGHGSEPNTERLIFVVPFHPPTSSGTLRCDVARRVDDHGSSHGHDRVRCVIAEAEKSVSIGTNVRRARPSEDTGVQIVSDSCQK